MSMKRKNNCKIYLAILTCCTVISISSGCGNSNNATANNETTNNTEGESAQTTIDNRETLKQITEDIDTMNTCCNEVGGIVLKYFDPDNKDDMWEAIMDYDTMMEFDRTRGDGSISRGEEPGRSSWYWYPYTAHKDREEVNKLRSSISSSLKNITPNSDEQNYYDAVKALYLNVDSYAELTTGFPSGYSELTFSQAISEHNTEYETLMSEVRFEE